MTAQFLGEAASSFIAKPRPMLIGENWTEGSAGEPTPVVNPSDGEVFAHFYPAGTDEIDQAVAKARAAFENPSWKRMAPSERTRLMWRLSDLIEEHEDELVELEVINQGLPVSIAREFVVPGVVETLRYYAGWCTKMSGQTVNVSLPDERPDTAIGLGYHAYTVYEAVGVVGAIIPWNFPLIMAAAKIAPALAAGCTVVLKPAEETPLSALRLGELILEAGFPPGVVNIVPGPGATAGARLSEHPDVDKIAFTGSTDVGRMIAKTATGNMKKVGLELGGKSPLLVFEDCDIEAATQAAAEAIFLNTGQVCFAGSRLFVQRPILDQVLQGVSEIASAIKVGPGHDPATEMGPLISARQKARVMSFFQNLEPEVSLMTGGTEPSDPGFFVNPTVALNQSQNTRLMTQEVFGPVLSVMAFDTVEEAAKLANQTDYGLAAGVFTRDLSTAHTLASEIKAGSFWVNCYNALDEAMTFGGFKQSGWGREGSRAGVEAYMESKSVVVKL